jgi:hypothetical protein
VLKKFAIAAAGAVAILVAFAVYCELSIRGTPSERSRELPGDEFIPNPRTSVTHGITIKEPPSKIWPWLAQMGADRAGWYAYDFVDNGRRPSANQILPEFQNVKVGTVFPALPGARDVFVVVRCDEHHALVLSWRSVSRTYFTTWAFVLEQPQQNVTRLIVRGRVGPQYHPYGLPLWLTRVVAPLVHGVMERKQLWGIKRRAESAP